MFAPVKWQGGNAACPPSVFRRYFDINVKRGLEEIVAGEVKETPLYIVCSGPSLLETWEELKDCKGEIWALNAAYDWLCKKGIRPDYGICLACEDQILDYFQEVGAGDKFLFASQTHPVLVDRVLDRGGSITFWHPAHPPEWGMPTPEGRLIYGGGTVGTRAIDLAWVLGFRDVHILGLDACLSVDGRIAVDRQMYEDRREDLRTWMVGGRAFVALPSHARQVEDFATIIRPLKGLTVTLYGDGLLQWAMKEKETE